MRPSEVLLRGADYLERHGVQSPRSTAEVLLLQVLGTDRAGLYTRTAGLDAGEARRFGRALCQRCAGVPLQHLTGVQAFRRLQLEVRPGVFVPRPETEVLVEHALAQLEGSEAPVVVDVGTGTGAVALALKDERPAARVLATDRSAEAVDLATANARRLGLEIEVLEGDLLEPVPAEVRGRLSLVVSNPPYIPPEDLDGLPDDVRADPLLALVDDHGVVERLAEQAIGWLLPGGRLALEIDARRGEEVAAILRRGFADVHIEPDLAGRDRVVLARAP